MHMICRWSKLHLFYGYTVNGVTLWTPGVGAVLVKDQDKKPYSALEGLESHLASLKVL